MNGVVRPGSGERGFQPIAIPRFDEDAGRTDDFRKRTNRGGDDRRTSGESFDRGQPGRLADGRDDDRPSAPDE